MDLKTLIGINKLVANKYQSVSTVDDPDDLERFVQQGECRAYIKICNLLADKIVEAQTCKVCSNPLTEKQIIQYKRYPNLSKHYVLCYQCASESELKKS